MATSTSASTLPGVPWDAPLEKGELPLRSVFSLDSSLVTVVDRLRYLKHDIKCMPLKLFAIKTVTGRWGKFRVQSYVICLIK